MLDFPSSALKKTLDSALFKGNVLRTEIRHLNTLKESFKRLILLNNDFKNVDNIYYVLTTSRVEAYINNEHQGVRGNYLFFKKGETVNNLDKDMIVDCRWVDLIKKSKLLENLRNGKLSSLKPFNDKIIKDIENIIKRSLLIPTEIKKLVCRDYF